MDILVQSLMFSRVKLSAWAAPAAAMLSADILFFVQRMHFFKPVMVHGACLFLPSVHEELADW